MLCFSYFEHSVSEVDAFIQRKKMPGSDQNCDVLREPRLVERKFLARPQHEGAGAIVRRSIGR
jgi:hypothetical protein